MPSASIITDVFHKTGEAMARSWGLKNFRFLELPHPIANLTPAELDARAEAMAPLVAQLLLEGQSA